MRAVRNPREESMAVPQRFPEWIRRKWASGEDFEFTKELVGDLKLHSVCQSANCPNIGECWSRRTATLMLLGNVCTRNCRYCSVDSGRPEALDINEPSHVAEAVTQMQLRHVVITSVTRDDLDDGGSAHIAETIRRVKAVNPKTTVEILIPDFLGDRHAIETVLDAEPEVFSHNIETVESLYPTVRGRQFPYGEALKVLKIAAEHVSQPIVKSALMVGHGETPDEVRSTLQDLLTAGCEVVNIGQYLRPSGKQRPVAGYTTPHQFDTYEREAYAMGFQFAVAGPFVRSSYRSEAVMEQEFARTKLRARKTRRIEVG
jgi:lipoic acid synthetase